MQIELAGLQPTLWFASYKWHQRSEPRMRFLFARVLHQGSDRICAMCRIVPAWSEQLRRVAVHVGTLHGGCWSAAYNATSPRVMFTPFASDALANAYAVSETIRMLASQASRVGLLMLSDMYDAVDYKDWEQVCVSR